MVETKVWTEGPLEIWRVEGVEPRCVGDEDGSGLCDYYEVRDANGVKLTVDEATGVEAIAFARGYNIRGRNISKDAYYEEP